MSTPSSSDNRAVLRIGRGSIKPVTGQQEPTRGDETPQPRAPLRAWIGNHPADVVDLFVYVVVLNLAIQFLPEVISENFTLSLLTAVLLKIALEIVLRLKGAAMARFRRADTPAAKVIGALTLWVVGVGSKLVVLWLIDIVFGGAVSLGGFIPVTLLVLVLLLARTSVRRLLYGTPME